VDRISFLWGLGLGLGEESLVSKYILSTCGLGVVVSSFVSSMCGGVGALCLVLFLVFCQVCEQSCVKSCVILVSPNSFVPSHSCMLQNKQHLCFLSFLCF
jgi:hypothetical protein